MFSQARNPWTRSLVREVPRGTDPDTLDWDPVPLEEVPGSAYPLEPRGINQNDVANYVSKTEQWTDKRIWRLRSPFAKNREPSLSLLVLKMRGELRDREVTITATPMLLFNPDRSFLHPSCNHRAASSVRRRSWGGGGTLAEVPVGLGV